MSVRRLSIEIAGSVQGVGFRPFVYRLALDCGLAGWVTNDTRGVRIEVQGAPAAVARFTRRLQLELPPAAEIERLDTRELRSIGGAGFRILASKTRGAPTARMTADLATCAECRNEVRDARDRRRAYPFTNCTRCGPRFSIVLSLPYDRDRTTMRAFTMCEDCRREYDAPADRRFHAQPNACPRCGPTLRLRDHGGRERSVGEAALLETARALGQGRIVAVKGLGGFHLMLDARSEAAVARLRAGKPRREKPLALMARDLEQARALCELDPGDDALLQGPAAPIVLLRRRAGADIAPGVAPDNPYLGVMLASTPLHILLLDAIGCPLVATSGNLADEPICIDDTDARLRLSQVAELFLVHDRPIARHVDDSVVWRIEGEPRLLRRARGFAPNPVLLAHAEPCVLAVGAQLKNTVALGIGHRAFVSQHIGEMETPQALDAFERVVDDFLDLYQAEPAAVAHDLHPDYATTRWARDGDAERLRGLPRIGVQHHHAHLAACLADNDCSETALGVIWDGTGYGTDGTVWGGEFLLGDAAGVERVAHLRPFRLPGGEAAVREPRRSALGLLWELRGEAMLDEDNIASIRAFARRDRELLGWMLDRDVNCPHTTSMGRLFDGVASIIGLAQHAGFEGQAAMAVEFAAFEDVGDSYPVKLEPAAPLVLDWRPLIVALLEDLASGTTAGRAAARFHNALIDAMVEVARRVDSPRVALSGGCFQNRRLVEHGAARLREAGFAPLLHRQVPPNDGGVALGQLCVARTGLSGYRAGRG